MYGNPMYGQRPLSPPMRTEVIHVSGRGGVEAFQMLPNCQALLWDDTAPIIWLVQTDGAGYKTITPLDVSVHEEPKPIDMKEIVQRLERLEVKVNESNESTAAAGNAE